MKKIMDGNEACSHISYKFTEVAGIYPITPSSDMAELTDEWAKNGKLNYFNTPVNVVQMESEAGAIGMVHGSLQSGLLTSSYTASQGLLLMIPNMYKIAGQLFPCVINVASRSIATHALSIFGDHQDIYATRSTGFAILMSSSVQEVHDLTGVAHLSSIKGKVPFLNVFDGFRTSHELQKIDMIDDEKLKDLIDQKSLQDFRNRALTPSNPVTRGTSQNEDIYFQMSEVRNEYYDKLPDIVSDYMDSINKITGKNYAPFNYYGSKNATKVIVAMGSVCSTIRETVEYLTEKKKENVGLLEVHLYRPFSAKHFLKVLPKTVRKIAVLDRTKEPGSTGEPLYLDVIKTIKEKESRVSVYGGRYGLSSKNTTPAMIKGVYDFLDSKDVHTNFTVGIEDDVTNLSISYDKEFKLPSDAVEFLIYGYGSDGMVSASKDLMKITGTHTKAYVQGYFQYDSKKSGGVTISHLRFKKEPIESTYYVENPSLVVCTKDSYLEKIKIFENIKKNGTVLLNTNKTKDEILAYLTSHDKEILKSKNIKLYLIDASKIARKHGLGNKISAIMETLIFKLGGIIDSTFATGKIKENIAFRFMNKSNNIVEKNIHAIDEAIDQLILVPIPDVDYVEEIKQKQSVYEILDAREGESLPVSTFVKNYDGTFESGSSKLDKRSISDVVPQYISENCISCNLCSLVCPHAVIRPFLLNENEAIDAPVDIQERLINANIKDQDLKYTIGISAKDCTGCEHCVNVCPGKKGQKALVMKDKQEIKKEMNLDSDEYLFNEVTEKEVMPVSTIKGSQFKTPKFEFSGACAGCGETAYLKLLTQLFGDNMVIANATGCTSIYGASTPSMPYSVPWANSLFEDNAEFGYGMKIADNTVKERIKRLIKDNIDLVKKSEQKIYMNYVEETTKETALELLNIVDQSKIEELINLKQFIMPKSVWMIGGDGWAYDIGYNGVDHVLANRENVNIFVLDTETYSNTGGQSSKSTQLGAIAKFASTGKKTAKKDLAKIALNYPHVYVGTISLGANYNQALKTIIEAENYDGPSLIIAYAPCIAQGIIKGMKDTLHQQKFATESGYFPLFRYHPDRDEFKLDSKADFDKYYEFMTSEERYKGLKKVSKEYKQLLEENRLEAEKRYDDYKSIEEEKKINPEE